MIGGGYEEYDDEGYIGGDDGPPIGASSPVRGPAIGADYDDGYGDEYYDDEYDPYYDDYYDDSPSRQPLFYVFIALAVVLGGLFIFLLFQVFNGDGDGPPPTPTPEFNVRIDAPLDNERVPIGEETIVEARANATEHIVRMELLVNGDVEDTEAFNEAPSDGIYRASLSWEPADADRYTLAVRAVSESGAQMTSDEITVIARESIDGRPARITGEIISTVNARQGPGDDFDAVRTLNPGTVVTIEGRTRNSEWLLLEDGTWIRRAAVRLSDSVDLVEVREPTPQASPSPTNTPEDRETPTPTPDDGAPDFTPTNATLIDGGAGLRVSVVNLSTSSYDGPLVVRVSGLDAGSIEAVFGVSVVANGATTVDFALSPPQTSGATIVVSVDPENSVTEQSEDNNQVSVVIAPPVEAPELVVGDASVAGGTVNVTVVNVGGDLASSNVRVVLSLGNQESASQATIALASGQSSSFALSRPSGSGTATITVLVDGQVVATGSVEIPSSEPQESPTTAG